MLAGCCRGRALGRSTTSIQRSALGTHQSEANGSSPQLNRHAHFSELRHSHSDNSKTLAAASASHGAAGQRSTTGRGVERVSQQDYTIFSPGRQLPAPGLRASAPSGGSFMSPGDSQCSTSTDASTPYPPSTPFQLAPSHDTMEALQDAPSAFANIAGVAARALARSSHSALGGQPTSPMLATLSHTPGMSLPSLTTEYALDLYASAFVQSKSGDPFMLQASPPALLACTV